jgi:serine/threonine protein kinase
MDGPTLVDSSGALDATIDSPSLAATVASPVSSARTTVLPRVEWGGGEVPKLVSTTRRRFEPKGALGEGGVGEVVAATDQDIGRDVAIKRLRPEVQGSAAVARFVDEIRTVGALEHPNIVPIHDVGVDENGALYFVMRKVQGATLESIIERLSAGDPLAHAHWTYERRAHLFRQLLEAVAFAHDRGFIHRDIKPANVMVGPFGEVFLMDWGIAKPIGAAERAVPRIDPAPQPNRVTSTHVGALIGTPAYMSPEQARGEQLDVRSDIYSLSVLLHEFLCLEHYLEGHTTVDAMLLGIQHKAAPLPSFVKSPHQTPVPADLGWFVSKGLSKNAADRYQTVREMIERLDARDEGVIPVQCPITFTKRGLRGMLHVVDRYPMLFMIFFGLSILTPIGLAIWWLVAR